MSQIILLIFLLLVLTLLSGYFSTAETAFFSLSSAKIHSWRQSTDKRRRHVAWLLAHSRYLLVLIFMLDNVSDVLLQNTASDLFDRMGGGWAFKVGVPLFLILIFGEFLPKYLGMVWNEGFAIRSASVLVALEKVTEPIQRWATSIAEVCSRFIFFFLKAEPPLTAKQVDSAIKTCESKGILSSEEAGLIVQTLTFEKKVAREVMVPRSEMKTIKLSELSVSFLKNFVESTQAAPLLIVDEAADKPIGVFSNATVLSLQDGSLDQLIKNSAKALFFVPETMPAKRLLHEFSSKQGEIACVIDEYGSISGYIEWEHILQTILGFTSLRLTGANLSLKPKQKSISLPGTTPLETVNELFGSSLQSKCYVATLGGWLSEVLDTIPQAGTVYTTDELLFKVLSANEKMVQHVFIQRKTGIKKVTV